MSGPLAGGTAALSTGVLAESLLVYVSLPPGSLITGDSVQIRHGASPYAPASSQRMANGGFDPVPIYAGAQDSVAITVFQGGHRIGPVQMLVPAGRPPVVVRTVPPKGRTDVALNQMIVVVFSQPLNPATITSNTVRLVLNGSPVPGTLGILPDQPWVVRFSPDTLLQPRSNYVLQVASGIVDAAGDSLGKPENVDFVTGNTVGNVAAIAVFAIGGYTPVRRGTAVATPGAKVTLTAFRISANGDTLTGQGFTWSSADPAIATVDTTGHVTAVALGSTTVSACVGAVCGSATIVVEAPQVGVTPTRIGDLGGGDSRIYAMNASGMATGSSMIAGTAPAGGPCRHAFTWTATQGMRDFSPAAECWAYPYFINDVGTVMGQGTSASSSSSQFLWSPSTGLRGVVYPDQFHLWSANAINNHGVVVFGSDSALTSALRFANGSLLTIPALAPLQTPTDINDAGDVLVNETVYVNGYQYQPDCGPVAWIWNANSRTVVAQLEPHYPSAGSPTTICAEEVNNYGVVAGSVNMVTHAVAFRWTQSGGFEFFPGTPTQLSRPSALNDAGDMTVNLFSLRAVGPDTLAEAASEVVLASGRTIPLGGLGGTHTFANGISSGGLVGGHSQIGSTTGPQQAVIWNISGAISAERRATP